MLEIDQLIFTWINTGMSNPVFDLIIPPLRSPLFWLPVYIFILFYFIYYHKKKGLLIVLALLMNVGFSDYVNSKILKPFFDRQRPCANETMQVIKRVNCGTGKSFPSSHAANHFGLSFFLYFILLKLRVRLWGNLALAWAGLVVFAQIYVGLHYPSDILAGMLEGFLWASLFIFLLRKTWMTIYKKVDI